MKIKAFKTSVFKEGQDLFPFIFKHVKKIEEGSVLVVTSKIVALSERRVVDFKDENQKIEIIKEESNLAFKTEMVWMTIKDGMVMANAGADESNALGRLILLPKDSFESAHILRKKLIKEFNLKNLGVLITDSRLMPLRAGVVGVALGYAGFEGLKNYVGKKDIFGRVLKMSKTDVADSLATSAVLCMGEGAEQQPLVLIMGAPVEFINKKVNKKELIIDPELDIYRNFWKIYEKQKRK